MADQPKLEDYNLTEEEYERIGIILPGIIYWITVILFGLGTAYCLYIYWPSTGFSLTLPTSFSFSSVLGFLLIWFLVAFMCYMVSIPALFTSSLVFKFFGRFIPSLRKAEKYKKALEKFKEIEAIERIGLPEAKRLVEKYSKVLQNPPHIPANENRLPASKKTLKEAIKLCLLSSKDQETYSVLKNAYELLSDFQPGVSEKAGKFRENLDTLTGGVTDFETFKKNVDPQELRKYILENDEYFDLMERIGEETEILRQEIIAWEKVNWDKLIISKKEE